METSAKTAFRFTERKGFTLAELLVAITIVAALSAVAVTYGNSYKAAQSNSMRLSHIETLKTAADGYRLAKGDYPEPKANSVRFSADGAYRHSGSGAYGVSSKASSDLFGAEFLSNVPSDPETGAFYGYGKRLDGTLGYDFATVDKVGDVFVAYVRGTYDASSLTSLIREHNGPGFVENGKSDRLPYDPYKTSITGKINNSSGTVTVNAGAKSPTAVIEEGDTIGTIAGGSAIVFLSDGTELNIGSPTQASELKFEELSVADPKGFLTKVRLALNSGEAWAKAPKLREAGDGRSELQMESGGAVASVRGTVFGMRKDPLVAGTTKIMLAEGSIVITKENGDPIPNYTSSTGTLSVPEGATPVTTDVIGGTSATTPTASGGLVEKKKKWNAKGMRLPVKIKKIVRVGNSYTISFDNPDGLPTAYGEILYDGGANG